MTNKATADAVSHTVGFLGATEKLCEPEDTITASNGAELKRSDLVIVLGLVADQRAEVVELNDRIKLLTERWGAAVGFLLFIFLLSLFF